MSSGPLSKDFPEVYVEVKSSFAHNRGMMSHLSALKVGEKVCNEGELLKELVSLRKGWTPTGGSNDINVIATVTALVEDWDSIFPYSGRLKDSEPTAQLKALLGRSVNSSQSRLEYHQPRVAIHLLADGDKIVAHSFFRTWDGGTHGRQYAYEVEAYRVNNGHRYEIAATPDPMLLFRSPAIDSQESQPAEPGLPRPRHLNSR